MIQATLLHDVLRIMHVHHPQIDKDVFALDNPAGDGRLKLLFEGSEAGECVCESI